MSNLSIQDVVLSIENAPLINLNGMLYQEYSNFFGKELLDHLNSTEKLNLVPLERQEKQRRSRVDEKSEIIKKLTKWLQIGVHGLNIGQILAKNQYVSFLIQRR